MSITLEEFQTVARSKTIEPGKRPEPYTPEQRAFALDHVKKEVAKGRSKSWVVSELGVAAQTLKNWQESGVGRKTFRPVSVDGSNHRAGGLLSLVTPRGYRVEGLSVADVASLLEKLQ